MHVQRTSATLLYFLSSFDGWTLLSSSGFYAKKLCRSAGQHLSCWPPCSNWLLTDIEVRSATVLKLDLLHWWDEETLAE